MTAITTKPGITALEALRAGECSANCLLSAEADRCRCRCQGTWHGALLRGFAAANTRLADP